MAIWIPLYLGEELILDEARLEVPERMGTLGGNQATHEHKFPGGVITHRSYGYFPGVIKWRAKFHGSDASDRVDAVMRILVAGREIQVSFGERSWLGRVVNFDPTAHHSFLYEYSLEFWPRVDTSSGLPSLPNPVGLGYLVDLHLLAIQGLIDGWNSSVYWEAVAAVAAGPLTDFTGVTQTAMLAAGGVVSSITTSGRQAIAASSLATLAVLGPLQTSQDSTVAAPASDAAARVLAISNITTGQSTTIATVQAVNPNLPLLAAQYYQDPTQWNTIAAANGLSDPMPVGSFNLVIPAAA